MELCDFRCVNVKNGLRGILEKWRIVWTELWLIVNVAVIVNVTVEYVTLNCDHC